MKKYLFFALIFVCFFLTSCDKIVTETVVISDYQLEILMPDTLSIDQEYELNYRKINFSDDTTFTWEVDSDIARISDNKLILESTGEFTLTLNSSVGVKASKKFSVIGYPKYKITYVLNDEIQETITYDKSMLPLELYQPTLENHTFLGWYLTSNFEGDACSVLSVDSNQDIVYYAKWATLNAKEIFDLYVPSLISESILLPVEHEGVKLEWNSSNISVLDNNGVLNKSKLLHKYQTIELTLTCGASFYRGEVEVAPILFLDLPKSVKAVYVAASSLYNYVNNSQRYKSERTLFSKTTKEMLDIVYYCFADPTSEGELVISDQFKNYLDEVLQLRENGVRVLVSINGATSEHVKNFSDLCSDSKKMDNFINNLVKFVNDYHFDGIDIDWEFPGVSTGRDTATDRSNMTTFIKKLRIALDNDASSDSSKYLLTTAIPSTSWGSNRYDFLNMNSSLDYVNMMSYDLNNTSIASHLSPLYSSSIDGGYKFSADYGVRRFVELGLSKEKIIIGSAAYGKAYATNQTQPLSNQASLTQIVGVTGSFRSGTIYYNGIKELLLTGRYKVFLDETAKANYLYSEADKIFITYDSIESIHLKCEYAIENEIGIMVWSYGEDANDEIVDAIYESFKKNN